MHHLANGFVNNCVDCVPRLLTMSPTLSFFSLDLDIKSSYYSYCYYYYFLFFKVPLVVKIPRVKDIIKSYYYTSVATELPKTRRAVVQSEFALGWLSLCCRQSVTWLCTLCSLHFAPKIVEATLLQSLFALPNAAAGAYALLTLCMSGV